MIALVIIILSSFFIIESVISLIWMLYVWENPKDVYKIQSPKQFIKPNLSFTALIPARFEEKVISDTIFALSAINYPEHLKEILILCRNDDVETIKKIDYVIRNTRNIRRRKNINLIVFNDSPINKPHSLNVGLRLATKDVVVVFDAEDQPHKDI